MDGTVNRCKLRFSRMSADSRVAEVQICRFPGFRDRAPRFKLERARNERSAERGNETEETIGNDSDGGAGKQRLGKIGETGAQVGTGRVRGESSRVGTLRRGGEKWGSSRSEYASPERQIWNEWERRLKR
jgi:hypothetical protein